MRISCVFFHTVVNLGGSHKVDCFDLRGNHSKVKPFISSMEYSPDTGEVVCQTTVRCPLTAGKLGVLRIPGSNVAAVLEEQTVVVQPKAKPAPVPKLEA